MPYMDSMGFDHFAKVGETLESSFFEDSAWTQECIQIYHGVSYLKRSNYHIEKACHWNFYLLSMNLVKSLFQKKPRLVKYLDL